MSQRAMILLFASQNELVKALIAYMIDYGCTATQQDVIFRYIRDYRRFCGCWLQCKWSWRLLFFLVFFFRRRKCGSGRSGGAGGGRIQRHCSCRSSPSLGRGGIGCDLAMSLFTTNSCSSSLCSARAVGLLDIITTFTPPATVGTFRHSSSFHTKEKRKRRAANTLARCDAYLSGQRPQAAVTLAACSCRCYETHERFFSIEVHAIPPRMLITRNTLALQQGFQSCALRWRSINSFPSLGTESYLLSLLIPHYGRDRRACHREQLVCGARAFGPSETT
jgi:hypothetical protein